MPFHKLTRLLLGLCCVFVIGFSEETAKAKKDVDIYVIVPPPGDCVKKAKDGDLVSIHYIGRLEDGTEFDTSYKEKKPSMFSLGGGQVIKGLEIGIDGMCVGEKRRLTIPSPLGYGSIEMGSVPPGSTLIFEVEVVDIKDQADLMDSFGRLDVNNDGALDMQEIREVVDSSDFQKLMPLKMEESTKNMLIQSMFTIADTNRDGMLDPSEYTKLTKIGANAVGVGKKKTGPKRNESKIEL